MSNKKAMEKLGWGIMMLIVALLIGYILITVSSRGITDATDDIETLLRVSTDTCDADNDGLTARNDLCPCDNDDINRTECRCNCKHRYDQCALKEF